MVKQHLNQLSGDTAKMRIGLNDLAEFALRKVKANESTLNGLTRLAFDKAMNYRVSLNDLVGFASMVTKRAS